MKRRREFLTGAAGVAAVAAVPAKAAGVSGKVKAPGGYRVGNLYYSSGLNVKGAGIKEQTTATLKKHAENLEAQGSSLDNVIKVTAYLADVKGEKPAFNAAYGEFFKKDAPARTALGAIFPDTETRVEIELVAWVP
jgi:2-iminobutanoate/2-iminopropanoate deaminase